MVLPFNDQKLEYIIVKKQLKGLDQKVQATGAETGVVR